MADKDTNKFGSIVNDVEGGVETRRVQTGGRLNIPDDYLRYIEVDEGDKVMLVAEDGEVKVKKASAQHLAVEYLLRGLLVFSEVLDDGE